MMPRGSVDLRTAVRFFSRTESVDGAGGPVSNWDKLAFSTRAKEETGAAGEKETSDQDASFSRVVFWIRYRRGVLVNMQVRRDGQIFDVKAVDAVGRKRWLKVITEKVNDG